MTDHISPTTGAGWLDCVGLTAEQEIRARAALAARPPYGAKTRFQVIEEIATYIRDGSVPEPRRRPPLAVE